VKNIFKEIFTRRGASSGDKKIRGRIILRWIFGKWDGVETGWIWLRIGTDGGNL